jgi:pimeloyl-ACP methyl ester carboxylesterase
MAIRGSDLDASLERLEAALIARFAPGTGRRSIRWSAGETQVLELGTGPPLLLVHGGLRAATDWLPIFPALARDHHVLAPDRPGHGLASPMDYAGVDVLDHATTFLREVLEALGIDRAPIVANAMGGRWAIELALREPQCVERLILVGAPAGTRGSLPTDIARISWPLVGRIVRWSLGRSSPASVRRLYGRTLVHHPDRLDDLICEGGAMAWRRNVRSHLSLVDALLTPAGIRPALMTDERWTGWRRLAVPVTFIWGERDAFGSPEFADRIAPLLPAGATVVRIPDAGHLPWWDEPLSIAREIAAALEVEGRRHADASHTTVPAGSGATPGGG